MLGIGIIGGGRICGAHAAAAAALPETRLAAIAEVDDARRAVVTEKWGCPGYADYRELLQSPEVDAVVIALPHWLHREVAVACLEAGKHLLVEKPLAMTVEECDAILEAAQRTGRTLSVAHMHRYFPVNAEARRLIAGGEIGRLVVVTDTWYKPFWEGQRPAWFLDASQGGGMWPMNGPHMIDRLCFFLDSEVVAVKATIGSPVFGLSATDMGAAFLQFASGVCAQITHVGYRDGVNRFEAEVTGTEGQLKISGDRGGGRTLWRSRNGQWEEITAPLPELSLKPEAVLPSPTFGVQLREFARAVLEERPPLVTAEYGRQVVRVLEACEESSRTGREVRLDGEA